MNIYIDFFSALPQSGGVKFHGGGGYTRNVIKGLCELERNDINIYLMCPKGFSLNCENEPELAKYKISCIELENALDYKNYEPGDIVYYPMLGYLRELKEIPKIKKDNPNVKVCATLHDIRFMEYTSDWTEKYYERGIKRWIFPISDYIVNNLIKRMVKWPALKRCLRALDEIYTVSNYSMQRILEQNKNVKLSWYYQMVSPKKLYDCTRLVEHEYILFVSGARPVKNLSHALIGFSMYKDNNPQDDTRLVITGISEEQFKCLCDMPGVSKDILENNCILYGYVSGEELASLYQNSRYILYTSKNEGFGLPVLEAASYGKTCVCSNAASIPEVMGAAVKYINPCDDESIAQAIAFMGKNDNLYEYERRIRESYKVVQKRMEIEQRYFLDDLLRN